MMLHMQITISTYFKYVSGQNESNIGRHILQRNNCIKSRLRMQHLQVHQTLPDKNAHNFGSNCPINKILFFAILRRLHTTTFLRGTNFRVIREN